jgi:hypothetical protein
MENHRKPLSISVLVRDLHMMKHYETSGQASDEDIIVWKAITDLVKDDVLHPISMEESLDSFGLPKLAWPVPGSPWVFMSPIHEEISFDLITVFKESTSDLLNVSLGLKIDDTQHHLVRCLEAVTIASHWSPTADGGGNGAVPNSSMFVNSIHGALASRHTHLVTKNYLVDMPQSWQSYVRPGDVVWEVDGKQVC